MRNLVRYICRCISSLFFEINLLLYKDTGLSFPIKELQPFQKTTCGIFFGYLEKDQKLIGLFANPQIGFFYKYSLHMDEITTELATSEELHEVQKYLANKISEYQEHLAKLDQYEVQPTTNSQRPVRIPTPKQNGALPLPPINVFVLSPYFNGALDIRWDNPAFIPQNTKFQIIGVNVYRSLDSEGGPYKKVNAEPLGAGVFRDITNNVLVPDEAVTNLSRGLNQQKEWRFHTQFHPIVKNTLVPKPAAFEDVVVKSDNGDGNGLMEVPLYKVHPETGEIVLISSPIFDPATEKLIEPRLPQNVSGSLTVTYYFNSNLVTLRLNNRIFYKLTTVALDKDKNVVESDLAYVTAVSIYKQESMDWIWKEAIRRNRWILEQGGERVKVFIRKWNGSLCPYYDETHITSLNDCPICYGTNYIGGYEGPFDIIIAPPDENKDIVLTDIGLSVRFMFETWTGPSPMLNKRDLVVRPSGERFTVGPINYVSHRGTILQQMFQVSQLDSKDFLYTLPIEGARNAPATVDTTREGGNLSAASPVIPSDKPTDRNYPLEEGRTVVFENLMF